MNPPAPAPAAAAAPAAPAAGSSNGAVTGPSVSEYDALLTDQLARFVACGQAIGGEVRCQHLTSCNPEIGCPEISFASCDGRFTRFRCWPDDLTRSATRPRSRFAQVQSVTGIVEQGFKSERQAVLAMANCKVLAFEKCSSTGRDWPPVPALLLHPAHSSAKKSPFRAAPG